MSSPANFMDYPDWTPEQRVSVTLVEVLRLKRAMKHHPSTLSMLVTSGEITPLPCTEPAVASAPYSAESQK